MAEPVHPDHPTLFLASDLDAGWTVLHYRGSSAVVSSVEHTEDLITVHFDNGTTDWWGPQDRVHAAPGGGGGTTSSTPSP